MKKTLLILLVSLLSSAASFSKDKTEATAPVCQFETMKFDFGDLTQRQEKSCTFKFKNVGNAPLVVSDVEKVCGVASVIWTKEPIAPGASGSVTVDFNAMDRPGLFRRTVIVKTNMLGAAKNVSLILKGKVLDPISGATSSKSTKSDKYAPLGSSKANVTTAAVNGARMDIASNDYNFGKIKKGETATYEFTFKNTGNLPLNINDAKVQGENTVSVDYPKQAIKPGESGVIKVTCNTTTKGTFKNIIIVKTNDVTKEAVELTVKAKVTE